MTSKQMYQALSKEIKSIKQEIVTHKEELRKKLARNRNAIRAMEELLLEKQEEDRDRFSNIKKFLISLVVILSAMLIILIVIIYNK